MTTTGQGAVYPVPRRLWTPDQGDSGLIVVARQKPLLIVMGGQLISAEEAKRSQSPPLEETRSPAGLVILTRRSTEARQRVIGHPDLATKTRYRHGDTLYVSIAEAVWMENQGHAVELHFEPDDDDRVALEDIRQRVRQHWENDPSPDGWTRPLPRRPRPRSEMPDDREPGNHGPMASPEPSDDNDWDAIQAELLRERRRRLVRGS